MPHLAQSRAVAFNARTDAVGDSIVVTDRPYARFIEEHPMTRTAPDRNDAPEEP